MIPIIGKPTETGERPCVVVGTISQEPKEQTTTNGKVMVKFGIQYAKASYMNCMVWGNNKEVATVIRCLEKRDSVLLSGMWSSREYQSKSGERKHWDQLTVEFAAPQSAITSLLVQMASGAGDVGDGYESEFADLGDDETGLPF